MGIVLLGMDTVVTGRSKVQVPRQEHREEGEGESSGHGKRAEELGAQCYRPELMAILLINWPTLSLFLA